MELPMDARAARYRWLALLLLPVAANSVARSSTGTYSTLAYNEESGDLHGLEVTIVPTDEGLVASVQIVEEGINELHLAKVKENGGVIRFSVRLKDESAVDFSMKCAPKNCSGEYVWGQMKVEFSLPKGNGYWNAE